MVFFSGSEFLIAYPTAIMWLTLHNLFQYGCGLKVNNGLVYFSSKPKYPRKQERRETRKRLYRAMLSLDVCSLPYDAKLHHVFGFG